MDQKRQIDAMANILYSDEDLGLEIVESVKIAEVLVDASYRKDLGTKELPASKEKQIEAMAEALDQAEQIHLGKRSYSLYGWSKIATMLYDNGYRKTFTSEFATDTQKAYKEGYKRAYSEISQKFFEELESLMLDGEIANKYPAKIIHPDKYAEFKKRHLESEGFNERKTH